MGKAIIFVFWVIGSVALLPTATGRTRDGRSPAERPPSLFGYELRAEVSLRRAARGTVEACGLARDTIFVVMPSRQWSRR